MTGPMLSADSESRIRAKKNRQRIRSDCARNSRPKDDKAASATQSNDTQKHSSRFSRYWEDAPGWGLSLLFHAAFLAILALVTITQQFRERLPEILAVFGQQEQMPADRELETAAESIEISSAKDSLEILEGQTTQSPLELSLPLDLELDLPNLAGLDTTELLDEIPSLGSVELSGRTAADKANLIAREGGTPQSEAAVALGLQWLANHQHNNGSWSFNHQTGRCRGRCAHPGSLKNCRTGATGLALLCFLGAGHTEQLGEYKAVVRRGVKFLVAQLKKSKRNSGSLMGPVRRNEGMYAHGIATLALCEAYNMGRNPKLREPVQQALNFIVRAQDPIGGGWRYQLREPGDTSVVGWQVMALYSGKIAELKVPQKTFDGAWYFLNSVQSDDGVGYGYTSRGRRVSPTLSAVGLLSRMYLGRSHGWDTDNPVVQEAADRLVSIGPSRHDMYYNYYATQYMYQVGGVKWRSWNDVMRDALVAAQDQKGHAAGSWRPTCPHGALPGGRLYMTTMCILTLEVYYRHLPIYERTGPAPDDDENTVGLK